MQKGERWRLMRRSSHWVSGRLIRAAYASSSIIYLRALASFAKEVVECHYRITYFKMRTPATRILRARTLKRSDCLDGHTTS